MKRSARKRTITTETASSPSSDVSITSISSRRSSRARTQTKLFLKYDEECEEAMIQEALEASSDVGSVGGNGARKGVKRRRRETYNLSTSSHTSGDESLATKGKNNTITSRSDDSMRDLPISPVPAMVTHNYHDHSQLIALEQPKMIGLVGDVNPFPLRLYHMLQEVEKGGIEHIVSWQPHGRCFRVHKPKLFINQVVKRFFNTKNIVNFQRQLNYYGFNRITVGPDKGSYYHQFFLRGKPFLIQNMHLIKVKATSVRLANNPAAEPNFYEMPFLANDDDSKENQEHLIDHDVIEGLGQNDHPGNAYYHKMLVREYLPKYNVTSSSDDEMRKKIALQLINVIKMRNPPGRFVKKTKLPDGSTAYKVLDHTKTIQKVKIDFYLAQKSHSGPGLRLDSQISNESDLSDYEAATKNAGSTDDGSIADQCNGGITKDLRTHDVVLGRYAWKKNHAGTNYYREVIIAKYTPKFHAAPKSDRKTRSDIKLHIWNDITKRGGRFLEIYDESDDSVVYRVLDHKSVIERIRHTLHRCWKKHRETVSQVSHQEDSSHDDKEGATVVTDLSYSTSRSSNDETNDVCIRADDASSTRKSRKGKSYPPIKSHTIEDDVSEVDEDGATNQSESGLCNVQSQDESVDNTQLSDEVVDTSNLDQVATEDTTDDTSDVESKVSEPSPKAEVKASQDVPFPKSFPSSFMDLVQQHIDFNLLSLETYVGSAWDESLTSCYRRRCFMFKKVQGLVDSEERKEDRTALLNAAKAYDRRRGAYTMDTYYRKLQAEVVMERRMKRQKTRGSCMSIGPTRELATSSHRAPCIGGMSTVFQEQARLMRQQAEEFDSYLQANSSLK